MTLAYQPQNKIPSEIREYFRMIPLTNKDPKLRGKSIVVPKCVEGNSATIYFSLAGNSAKVGDSNIYVYQNIEDVIEDAIYDAALETKDLEKRTELALKKIQSLNWWKI